MSKSTDKPTPPLIPWWARSDIIFDGSRILTTVPFAVGGQIDLPKSPSANNQTETTAPRTRRQRCKKPWPPKDDGNEHYTPNDLAELWGYSVSTIRRAFEDEEGVLRLTKRSSRKRQYATVQIPQDVALRVYRRLKGKR